VNQPFPQNTDEWLLESAPFNAVVISSRARLARNLPHIPFAPRASNEQLRQVTERVRQGLARNPWFQEFASYDLAEISPPGRGFLRESHLISSELEKGGVGRLVYLNPAMDASIMINEEDHLRMCTLISGLRVGDAYQRLARMEEESEKELELAYNDEFGYLTACPTNTGTGLRLSVMMHLPALVMIGQVEDTLASLASFGLIVRGSYGEHSEHAGDLFQISNEITLGKSEEQIMAVLEKIVRQIIDRELQARELLLREARDKVEDAVCRAIGLLATARRIDSLEAIALLSRTRLGIGQDWGMQLSHPQLSRLFVEIQPSHLQYVHKAGSSPDERDLARARLLRARFAITDENAQNN
jgi:protein arginine kinase